MQHQWDKCRVCLTLKLTQIVPNSDEVDVWSQDLIWRLNIECWEARSKALHGSWILHWNVFRAYVHSWFVECRGRVVGVSAEWCLAPMTWHDHQSIKSRSFALSVMREMINWPKECKNRAFQLRYWYTISRAGEWFAKSYWKASQLRDIAKELQSSSYRVTTSKPPHLLEDRISEKTGPKLVLLTSRIWKHTVKFSFSPFFWAVFCSKKREKNLLAIALIHDEEQNRKRVGCGSGEWLSSQPWRNVKFQHFTESSPPCQIVRKEGFISLAHDPHQIFIIMNALSATYTHTLSRSLSVSLNILWWWRRWRN